MVGAAQPRRAVVAALVAAFGAVGCGFRLQQPVVLGLKRVALVGFSPRSGVAAELRRALGPAVEVFSDAAPAEVVVVAMQDLREKSVLALSAGQVREVQLRVKFRYRLLSPQGRELTPAADIALARDMSFSESIALAKQREEAELYREMEADIARQVLRRLASLPR